MEKKVGTLSQFEENLLTVTVDSLELVLMRHPDGTVSALEDRCSHADVRLSDGDFDAEEGTITCIAHGAKFCAKDGQQLCMPAVTPVPAFAVRVDGEEVFVDIPG